MGVLEKNVNTESVFRTYTGMCIESSCPGLKIDSICRRTHWSPIFCPLSRLSHTHTRIDALRHTQIYHLNAMFYMCTCLYNNAQLISPWNHCAVLPCSCMHSFVSLSYVVAVRMCLSPLTMESILSCHFTHS